MCLCHCIMSMCSGRFVKGISTCDSKWKSLGASTTFKCCVLLSVQYLAVLVSHLLYSSKDRYANAENSLTVLFQCTCAVLENSSKTISLAYIRLVCVCVCLYVYVCVDMENRRREEFGVAVAHFFFSSCSVFPLSLRCCQSPRGRISAATIGRPRLSKYTF